MAILRAHGNYYLHKYEVGTLCLKVSFYIKMLNREQDSCFENMVKIVPMIWVTLSDLV